MTTSMYSKIMTRAFAGLITWVLLCGPAFTVNAQNYFVAPTGSDSADGTSWSTPFLTIQKGIDAATAGQTVAVSNGTYVLTTQLLLNKGITLQGFGGASNTVIDANATGRAITISSATALLDGFTVRGGSVAGNGAGLSMSGGEVKNCIVMNNTISGAVNGGGVYMTGGMLNGTTVSNNTITANWANGRGGGVYVSGGAVVTNCLISGNLIDGTDPYSWGAGVYIDTGTVVDCTIRSNNAAIRWSYTSYGGGAYLATSGALLERCILSANRVSQPAGSAVNAAGGGLAMAAGTVRSCLLSGNESARNAGGAYITGGTFENCTVVRNKGTINYGGVYWTNSPSILNTIVYNNTGGVENNIMLIVGGVSGVTYSCAPSLTTGTGNASADPVFVDSGIGSGLSFTAGDYRPVIGSPCEKTGLVSGWMSSALDLAGLARLNGAQVDMGCHLVCVPPKSTYVAETGSDSNDGTSWATAFKTIQKGIDTATALGTVSVSNGTYVLTSQILLSKGCMVLGVSGSSNTVINANASGRAITISSGLAILDGFTVRNGSASDYGAGINISAGQVRNCIITNNSVSANWVNVQGGGVYMSGGMLRDSMVANNSVSPYYSDGRGGGVYVSGGAIVTNCLISGNVIDNATDLEWARGGGLYVSEGTVVDCRITNNKVNKRWRNSSYGGGVYLDHVNALLDRCIVSVNEVSMLGLGVDDGRLGGGVAIRAGTARSSLISGNQARNQAGGVWMDGGTLENCTIVRNAAVTAAYGGVYWTNSPAILNNIVYNNTSASGESNILAVVGGVANVTYSCAPSLTSGTGNITSDPQFTASGSGSGTTFTPGDYRLIAGTPCRNKGLTEQRMKTATDLDRLPRVKDFLVDMGAYERQTNSGSMIKFF